MLKSNIRKGLAILSNPEKAIIDLKNDTLEAIVGYYISLLLLTSAAASIANFLFSIVKVAYFDVFLMVDVDYLSMLNYQLGRSLSLAFLYLFFGTFIMFFISVILKFFFTRIKYTDLLKILLFASTPFLLFGWVPFAPYPLVIWWLFLLATGIINYKAVKIRKGSIQQRY